jgi:DNA-binding GntR family transcriptional regulator
MTTSVDPALALAIRREESLTSIIRREIERMIDERELNPGDWINEAMLASRLKVSRGPVREACRGLEQNGLLQVVVNRGVFVRKIELKDAAELYDLRAALFALAGRMLASKVTRTQVAVLRKLVDAMDRAASDEGDLDKYYPLNLQFHRKLCEFAGNARLLATYLSLVRELHLFRRRALEPAGRMADSNGEHRRILDAIAAHDAEGASRLMEAHVLASKGRSETESSDTKQPAVSVKRVATSRGDSSGAS